MNEDQIGVVISLYGTLAIMMIGGLIFYFGNREEEKRAPKMISRMGFRLLLAPVVLLVVVYTFVVELAREIWSGIHYASLRARGEWEDGLRYLRRGKLRD